MKNLFRIICLILCVALLAGAFCACGDEEDGTAKKSAETTKATEGDKTESGEATEPAPVTETESETETETEAEPEPAPSAGGEAERVYDLVFELPAGLTAGSYNGLVGVYEWYSGEMANGVPTGIYFAFVCDSESKAEGGLEKYVAESSEAAQKGFTSPEKVTFNGQEWLRCQISDGEIYYYTIYGGILYTIMTFEGDVSAEEYASGIGILEQTLFFSPEY